MQDLPPLRWRKHLHGCCHLRSSSAKLVGLGDLDNKIKKILEKVQAPVNKAIDWCDKVLQESTVEVQGEIDLWWKRDEVAQAKQEIAKKTLEQNNWKRWTPTDLRVSSDGALGDAPKVNFGEDGGNNNAGLDKPQKLSPACSRWYWDYRSFNDLGARDLAAQYPNLGTAISEKEAVAQKSMEENIPGLDIKLHFKWKTNKETNHQAWQEQHRGCYSRSMPGTMFPLPTDGETLVKGAGERPTLN